MKLNGALKPRQGASKKGCSPGVVFKKYRIKRYFKVNKNVVNGQPLHVRGAKNKKSFNDSIVINSNCISINNKQPAKTTSLSQRLEHQRKSGAALSRSTYNSLSKINFSTSTRIKKQIDFTIQHNNTTQSRVAAVKKTKACHKNLNNRRSTQNLQQKTSVTVAVAAAAPAKEDSDTEKVKDIKRKVNTHIKFKPEAVTNITTRLNTNNKLKEKSTKNKNHKNKSDERITKQVNKSVNENKSHSNINKNNLKQVNKFLFFHKINAKPNLIAIILRLFIQLKLLLFPSFSHAIKQFTHFGGCGRGVIANIYSRAFWIVRRLGVGFVGYNSTKMMPASQFIVRLFESIYLKNARGTKSPVALYMVIYAATAILLPLAVVGDDGETFFPINGIETTTPEFDYASRGQKKFGDKCDNTLECGFPGSICDPKKKSCQCTEDLPVTNHIDKCGKEAAVNESCFFNEQCEVKYFQTECRDQRCVCRFDMTPIWLKDGSVECKGRGDKKGPETYIDPAMIGVLIGMALMFIIICVVLRLFSQARWRENRTIFNTPNPRLMNVSLLRESKLLHGQERRGSRMSVRAPSRQPSMASLRPHSPNPSLGKTGSRSNSHGSNASATSLRSTRSNCVSPAGITVANNSHHERKSSTYQPHQHHHQQQQKLEPLQQEEEQQNLTQTNIISNPVAETVTVEIIEPEKFTKSTE